MVGLRPLKAAILVRIQVPQLAQEHALYGRVFALLVRLLDDVRISLVGV